MDSWNGMLYQTLSCRTGRLHRLYEPVDPVRALLLWALLGVLAGASGCRLMPGLADLPFLTQGLAVSDGLRTLWDVCRGTLLPMLCLIALLLLSSSSAIGQPLAMLTLFARGIGAGAAAAGCFAAYPFSQALRITALLILPCAFGSILILIFLMRRCMTLSCGLLRYLLRGEPASDIRASFFALCRGTVTALLLTVLCCGLHTALIWLLNDRLLGAA